MLRSGPFSDTRIIGLLNTRFVPYYFDLGKGSPAGDDDAKAFVVAAKKVLGGSSVPTPPIMIMTPDGELVAEVSNYATEQEVLVALREVLGKYPEYAAPADEEESWPRLRHARLAHWLGADTTVQELLAENRSPAESLFLAQVARQRGDLIRSRAALDELDVDALAADLLLERGLIAWKAGDLETMRKDLAAYPAAGPRSAEARYHLGLALFHLGDPESARATWADLVETFGENRWSYRADWAWSQTTDDGIAKQKRSFTTMGAKSLLGRHGYMGRQNPDLVMDPGLDESAQ